MNCYLFNRVHIASFRWALPICKYFPQCCTKCPNICCYWTTSKIKIRVKLCWNPVDTAKLLKLYYKSVKFKDISTSVECLEKIWEDNDRTIRWRKWRWWWWWWWWRWQQWWQRSQRIRNPIYYQRFIYHFSSKTYFFCLILKTKIWNEYLNFKSCQLLRDCFKIG